MSTIDETEGHRRAISALIEHLADVILDHAKGRPLSRRVQHETKLVIETLERWGSDSYDMEVAHLTAAYVEMWPPAIKTWRASMSEEDRQVLAVMSIHSGSLFVAGDDRLPAARVSQAVSFYFLGRLGFVAEVGSGYLITRAGAMAAALIEAEEAEEDEP